MRTFVAIDLTPEIKSQLETLVKKLKPVARNLKWVSKENYHLTLKFLGEIDENQVKEVKSILEVVAQLHHPFQLSLQGTGSFPPGQSRLRVVWVGISADTALFEIQKEIEDLLEEKDFPREERPFSPHLTIGRAKVPERLDTLKRELEKLSGESFGTMEVKEITFFQSILKPEGPEYRILSQHKLL
jgi:2'-5' RNA ligase